MKIDKSLVLSFVLLVIVCSLYRIMPGRPLGFAPQIAMALFAGSIVKNKKYSFLMPLLSMLVSDIIYETLFQLKISTIPGFYDGQVTNYILFAAVTVIGFWINKNNWLHVFAGSLIGATFYFVLSNFLAWTSGLSLNNLPYPKTFAGLTECFTVALPFYKGSLAATVCFSAIFFGSYYLINKSAESRTAIA